MYQPTDLKGVVYQIDGKPYRVVESKVSGSWRSVNVKLKNLIDGSVIPKASQGALFNRSCGSK